MTVYISLMFYVVDHSQPASGRRQVSKSVFEEKTRKGGGKEMRKFREERNKEEKKHCSLQLTPQCCLCLEVELAKRQKRVSFVGLGANEVCY